MKRHFKAAATLAAFFAAAALYVGWCYYTIEVLHTQHGLHPLAAIALVFAPIAAIIYAALLDT